MCLGDSHVHDKIGPGLGQRFPQIRAGIGRGKAQRIRRFRRRPGAQIDPANEVHLRMIFEIVPPGLPHSARANQKCFQCSHIVVFIEPNVGFVSILQTSLHSTLFGVPIISGKPGSTGAGTGSNAPTNPQAVPTAEYDLLRGGYEFRHPDMPRPAVGSPFG